MIYLQQALNYAWDILNYKMQFGDITFSLWHVLGLGAILSWAGMIIRTGLDNE